MVTLTAIFISISAYYNLPPNLLSSICYIESTHNVSAVHHDDGGGDSLGICQIKLSTAKDLGFKGTAEQLMAPSVNIKYAGKYLKYQIKRYNGSVKKAVIAYNLGHAGSLTYTKYQDKVYKQWRHK